MIRQLRMTKRRHTTMITARRPRHAVAQSGGFSLIEVLLAVVLVGILSSVVVIRLGSQSIGNPGAQAMARRLALDLQHARSLAITERVNHYVGFDANGSSLQGYTIYRTASPSDIAVEAYRSFNRGVTATGSTTRAEFSPTGAALSGYSFQVSGPSENHSVTVIAATGLTMVSQS